MKRLLVTGAARGIGRAIARRFVAEGWEVVGLDHDAETLREAAEAEGFAPLRCDLADPAAIEAACASVGRLDALVNNAATSAGDDPLALPLEAWERVIAVNLTAPFLLARRLAPALAASNGCIVNIASTRALMSEPHTEAYSASKGGILALTHALAMSLAPLRVNAVSPGWIEHAHPESLRGLDHDFHPAGRVGRSEDIAAMVSYLCSDAAGFITAQNFVVDGGVTKKMIYPE